MCDGVIYDEDLERMAHGAVSRWLGSYWPEDDVRDEETVDDTPTCPRCGLHLLVSEIMDAEPVCGPCRRYAPDPDQNTLDF